MIRSFACIDTDALFHSRAVSRLRNIERVVRRKLLQIHAATDLPRFWLNLQSEYDIRVADWKRRATLSPRIRVIQPAVA